MSNRKRCRADVASFIRENCRGTGHQQMADMIAERFGVHMTKGQIKAYYANHKLSSGLTGYFEKGQEAFNKGKTWDEFMSPDAQRRCMATSYKKSHVPDSHRNVGDTRVNADGYRYIKVGEPNHWMAYHKYVYKREKGEIPDGYILTFIDGNPLNCDIDNLGLETRPQSVRKNQSHIRGYDRQSFDAANMIADIMNAKSALKRRRKSKGKKDGQNDK